MKAILVPIDNRPVTYVFPQLIAQVAGVEALVPARTMMGSLQANTNVDALGEWVLDTLHKHKPEALLVCLDSIIYGGLIPSRRSDATTAQMLDRAKMITRWKKASPNTAIYAQSSIMRISDNYDNTEEKQYWSRYGREIFAWSEAMHRMSGGDGGKIRPGELSQLESRVPAEIRKDYLDTRQRNFQVNRKMLDYAQSGDLDLVIYSQDDSGEYGLNVLEKQRLIAETQKRGLKNVLSYAGADEVLMTMFARFLLNASKSAPSIKLSFSPSSSAKTIASRYEGQSIGESVVAQLNALGIDATTSENTDNDSADLHIIIHTSGDRQGDHIWLPGHPDVRSLNTQSSVVETMRLLKESNAPCVVCDVAYSNGSDPALVEALLNSPEILRNKIWGYAGWNTTGNTLGSAFAAGIARWFASTRNASSATYTNNALKSALFIRLADDWAYQTQSRKALGTELSLERLRNLMEPHLVRIASTLDFHPRSVQLALPWQRAFEVEIQIQNALQPTR